MSPIKIHKVSIRDSYKRDDGKGGTYDYGYVNNSAEVVLISDLELWPDKTVGEVLELARQDTKS